MSDPSADPIHPRIARATRFGVLAGVGVALVYGVLTDPFAFTLALIVVGIAGGYAIGLGVSAGAWSGKTHGPDRRVGRIGAAIALVAWLAALVIAFILSQVFFPSAATSLAERLTPAAFVDYLAGIDDFVKLLHLASLALMALFAYRGGR